MVIYVGIIILAVLWSKEHTRRKDAERCLRAIFQKKNDVHSVTNIYKDEYIDFDPYIDEDAQDGGGGLGYT